MRNIETIYHNILINHTLDPSLKERLEIIGNKAKKQEQNHLIDELQKYSWRYNNDFLSNDQQAISLHMDYFQKIGDINNEDTKLMLNIQSELNKKSFIQDQIDDLSKQTNELELENERISNSIF